MIMQSCTTRNTVGLNYKNPVYTGSMPDPGVMTYHGKYYAFGTTGTDRLADGRIFTVLCSDNLVDWKELGGALVPPSDNSALQYWAPEAAYFNGKFYLYYSQGDLNTMEFRIRVAVSDKPEGPYVDNGQPLKEGTGAKFFIDGHPFQDDDGQWYFFYAKDYVNTDDGCMAGTGVAVDRLVNMTQLAGQPKMVVRPRYPWTLFQANRQMPSYGNKIYDWHTIEAPYVWKHKGKYFCFYSGSNFGTIHYGLDYVVADSPMGPYRDQGEFARVLRGIPGKVRGPGHHSIVIAPDGKTEIVVYHAWNEDMSVRQMCIDPLVWTDKGPRCAGPTDTIQSLPTNTDQ